MIVEFLELTFSRHGSWNILSDATLALARSSPTRRYTGVITQSFLKLMTWSFVHIPTYSTAIAI